jgi:hypothetical protein
MAGDIHGKSAKKLCASIGPMSLAARLARRVRARTAAWLIPVLLASFVAALRPSASPLTVPIGSIGAPQRVDLEQKARVTCGGCHAFPPPDILPRAAWRDEFVRMMFIRDGRLPPVGPPEKVYGSLRLPADMEEVLPFYTAHAPERLSTPEPWPLPQGSPRRFSRRSLTLSDLPGTPAVSNVQLVDLDGDNSIDILGSDMRHGVVFAAQPAANAQRLTIVSSIPHPAHVSVADVDRDGVKDLLVAELGEFFPADHDKGAVIWMRGVGAGKFSAFWLDGWPRVADVEAADFNGDGRQDLAVGAFGWRKSGRLSILENASTSATQPAFPEHVIDRRSGTIHAVPTDLNRDGKMDLVALLAQEHESVIAYINRGAGFTFEPRVLYAAPHPNWGSSGIQVVDFDKDGDLDVLLTHGDTFDDGLVKPYHGIQWLENTGGYPFVEHTLAQMPGVHRAVANDLDGDGDLDVVAAALLAGGSDIDEKTLPALIWLEQTKPGTFARHSISIGFPRHATLDVGDVDGDGDVDIVTGTFSIEKSSGAWVDVWVNESRVR